MGVDGSSGFERRHELQRQLFYIILIAGTLVFFYMFHGANRYSKSTSVERMTTKQKNYRASLISELEIPFSDCEDYGNNNNKTNVYRMGAPNLCGLRKQHRTSNITLWILLDDESRILHGENNNDALFTSYFRLRCHMLGTFENVRISPSRWILQKRIMPGDVAIVPVTLAVPNIRNNKKKQYVQRSIQRRINRTPRQLAKMNRWRKRSGRNDVRIGVLHFYVPDVDKDMDMDIGTARNVGSQRDLNMNMNIMIPGWYEKADFVVSNIEYNDKGAWSEGVQFFPMLPKMPDYCVPRSPLLPPRGATTCTCGTHKEVLPASKRKFVYAVHARIRERIENGLLLLVTNNNNGTAAIGRISPKYDLTDAMFAVIPCAPSSSYRVSQSVYQALTLGAIPVVHNCTNNNNIIIPFAQVAHKHALEHIAQTYGDSEDPGSPDLKKIDIAQENILQLWNDYSTQLTAQVLRTITNSSTTTTTTTS